MARAVVTVSERPEGSELLKSGFQLGWQTIPRKRPGPSDKGKQVQAAPSGNPTGQGELFELPNVWSKPDRFGRQSTFILNDRKLRVINDLGVAGRIQAMTEGIIGAMKALEISVVLNNSSTEGMVRVDAVAKERDEALAKKEKLDDRRSASVPKTIEVVK